MWWKTAVYAWLERERRSQAFLAREAGIDSTYLSRCLNDRVAIGKGSLRKLETAMRINSGTLMLDNGALDKCGVVPESDCLDDQLGIDIAEYRRPAGSGE